LRHQLQNRSFKCELQHASGNGPDPGSPSLRARGAALGANRFHPGAGDVGFGRVGSN
jgi:hypothetical protein